MKSLNVINRHAPLSSNNKTESRMSNHFKAILFAAATALLVQNPAWAADEYNVSRGITTAGVPLGLHGIDAVALTSLGAVSEGDAVHTVVHDGAAYYFASQASADLFSANPEKYLPQYGGFCAYAVALGRKFDGDPMFADIVDGKLYLFVNDEIFRTYKKNPQKYLSEAEKMWPKIQHTAVDEL